ncbi:MAG: TonB-dependent receptor [Burkholderiales bacterium]|nr:TonB-dependent receptor [Burkholderiales bacterium]
MSSARAATDGALPAQPPRASRARDPDPTPRAAKDASILEEVRIVGTREPRRPDTARAAPVTRIDRARIERFAPASIFEAVEGVPGLSINGGPRASGMSFSIRGYGDSEDVLVKLDGAQKNFEKYRFGGTFIEPELLKNVTVTRGPDLLQGAGALGGTVAATTRDAADLLKPGERIGARLKWATATVNDEISRSGTAFARPTDRIDLLVSATRRGSDAITLADGSKLDQSSGSLRSVLFKGSVTPIDPLTFTVSQTELGSRALEPFDATGGQPGFFGFVTRRIDDSTTTFTTRFTPASVPWIDLTAIVGRAITHVNDFSRPGQSFAANAFTGDVTQDFRFDVLTADVKNTARFAIGHVRHELVTTVQFIDNAREVTRFSQNPAFNRPEGFDPTQPPGSRESTAAAGVWTMALGHWTFAPGLRIDRYRVSAAGGTLVQLARFGEPAQTQFDETTASGALTWRPGGGAWLAGYRYVEAFRPPLIDEAFTQGAFSRCIPFNLQDLAPRSRICGSLYRPERAATQEWSVSYAPLVPRWPGVQLEGRAAWFRNERGQLLQSIRKVGPGEIGQPGWEHREGVEIDAGLATRQWFGNVAWSRITGNVFDGRRFLDLYEAPGDTLSATLGLRWLGGRMDAGVRVRDVNARSIAVGVGPGGSIVTGRQEGFTLLDLFWGWRPGRDVEVRLSLDNATNEAWFLNNGFGGSQGAPAPGRNFRVSVAAQF